MWAERLEHGSRSPEPLIVSKPPRSVKGRPVGFACQLTTMPVWEPVRLDVFVSVAVSL
jgi:hypothetical protein